MRQFADAERVDVVTNGVDVDRLGLRSPPGPGLGRPTSCSWVRIDYFANAEGIAHFAKERVFPLDSRPPGRDATLRVSWGGSRDADVSRELGDDRPAWTVVGEVDDMRPEVCARRQSRWSPLRIAQGLQNKVLEAMAAGVPVVSVERRR